MVFIGFDARSFRARRRLALLVALFFGASLVGTPGTTSAQTREPREQNQNFDGRPAANAGHVVSPSATQLAALNSMRRSSPDLAVTFDDSTGVTRLLHSRGGYLAEPRPGQSARDVALQFVQANLEALGLSAADLSEYETTDVVVNRATGSTHLYLRQLYRGLPVYNGQLQINVNRNGRVLSVNNAFQPALAQAVNTLDPNLGAAQAVLNAAEHLAIANARLPDAIGPPQGVQRVTRIVAPLISVEPMDARLMLLPIRRGQVRLVWNFQIHRAGQQHIYDLTADAVSGEVWTRIDWVASDQYRVYPMPVESPNHTAPTPPADGRVVVSNPAHSTASPYGWHDTNGVSGPEFTNMRGNNVHAYDDQDSNGSPPATEPSCGSSLVCDFPIGLNADPTTYTSAAVANLFYWNNIIHDVQYQYGFTEAAGNFQVNNYGRGGLGNDDVRAEAQDGGGTNNANFSTPPDGSRPRMQMYLWTQTTPKRDGDFDDGIVVHEYGHGISNRLVGGPSNVSCLANAQQPGEGLSDWWSLVYTAKAGDVGATGRGVGTYALGQPTTGQGIRTQRYSTDPTINTWTYASISGMAIPHGVGSVWAQAAWEMYWALVNEHGFSTDLYNAAGTAGNQRAMLYVNEGLMNTACSPTFTDVRDGIIQAATDNHGGEDVCLLWDAFANFGLGVNAVSGGPGSVTPSNGFGRPLSCLSGAPSISIGDATVSEGNSGMKNATFPVTLSAPSTLDVAVNYQTVDGTAASNSTANTGIISIPSSSAGPASPYPSTITVPAGVGLLTKVWVKLNRFSHTYPQDVDVLLVGPVGQSVVLMSDAGSSFGVVNVTFTFDDTGQALGSGALTSGTYKPTNINDSQGSDSYPSPAPAGPYGSTLSVFNGTDPAGTWKLFVTDDFAADGGSFEGGWTLELTPGPPNDYISTTGTLTFSPGTTSQNLDISVVGDTDGEATETFLVNLSNESNASIADGQATGTILNDDSSTFTDDPLVPGSTVVKALHITELRFRIDLVRVAKALAAYTWSAGVLNTASTTILAQHIQELRTALGEAYTAASRSLPVYTDPVLMGLPIRAIHISELRTAVIAIE